MLARRSAADPLHAVATFDYRLTVTESLEVAPPRLPPGAADAAAVAATVKQPDALDFRYVPFGATHTTAAAEQTRKRKRKETGVPSAKKLKKKKKKKGQA